MISNDNSTKRPLGRSAVASSSTPASDYVALKVVDGMMKGDRGQNSSARENSNVTSGRIVQPGVSKTYVCSMLLILISSQLLR